MQNLKSLPDRDAGEKKINWHLLEKVREQEEGPRGLLTICTGVRELSSLLICGPENP